jgi:hypothetical protein
MNAKKSAAVMRALCVSSPAGAAFSSIAQFRQRLSHMFQEDVLGLNGMRALVLIGNDDLLLAQWSESVVRAGDGELPISIRCSQ